MEMIQNMTKMIDSRVVSFHVPYNLVFTFSELDIVGCTFLLELLDEGGSERGGAAGDGDNAGKMRRLDGRMSRQKAHQRWNHVQPCWLWRKKKVLTLM